MAVQLAEGLSVSFTSEQCRLLRVVTKHPQDYGSWRALVDSVVHEAVKHELDMRNMTKVDVVFTLFLDEFPVNYTDFVEYAELSKHSMGAHALLEHLQRDAISTSYSLERWQECFKLPSRPKHESISRLLDQATQKVGSYYQSDELWRMYIEHETTNKNWTALAKIYKSLFSSPVRGIETFFEQFKIFVNEHQLCEILSAEEFSLFREKSTYIASREKLVHQSKQDILEIKKFEELIIPDSEAEALDEQIISNWFSYFDFLKGKGDSTKVIAVYQRAYFQLHSYPDFWISYVDYLLSQGNKEQAEAQLNFATTSTLKRNVRLLLYSAQFRIANNDLNGARNTYVLIHSILSPNHPEAIEGHAMIELKKKSDGSLIFKNAIDSEKKKGNSELLLNLLIKYGCFARLARIPVSFDDIFGDFIGQASLSLSTIQSAISLCSLHGFKSQDQILILDRMVDSFVNNRPLTNQEEKEALSSYYIEFLHRYGNTCFLHKATSRHEQIVSHNGDSCERSSKKKRVAFRQDVGLSDGDLTVLSLDQFLAKVVLVKDSEFQLPKVLPIGTNLLVAVCKPMLKRHRCLRSWGGQLDARDIFITYDGSESSMILCSIRKDTCCDLSGDNFSLDWTGLKKWLTPAFTSQLTDQLPVYFNDFFARLIEKVPANFLSHIESRELYFFRISCSMFLSTPSVRMKLVCDLFKCFRDAFFRSEVQFDSIFDSADMSNACHLSVSNQLLERLLNYGKEENKRIVIGVGPNQEFTPSQLVTLDRHLDAHGTEVAKSIGVHIKSSEDLADLFDHTGGSAFCGMVWDLCQNMHRHDLLEDACVAFSSNIVEPPRANPFLLSRQPPKLSPGITESGCLMAAEPCYQRTRNFSCVLWFGKVEFWANEVKLFHEFAQYGKVKTLKLRRNVLTGLPEGDGLVEFNTHQEAQRFLGIMQGKKKVKVQDKPWAWSWATFSCSSSCFDSQEGYCMLVKDLVLEVSDYILQEEFRNKCTSFAGAVVARDPNTGLSLGYGFVKFADEADLIKALSLAKKKVLGRPMQLVRHNARVIPSQSILSGSAVNIQDPSIFNRRPDLNHWVGSYRHAQVQSYARDGCYGKSIEKVDDIDNHVRDVEEDDVACEQTSIEKMNQSYASGPGRAVLGILSFAGQGRI